MWRLPLAFEEARTELERIQRGQGAAHHVYMIDVDRRTVGVCWLGRLDLENRSASLGILVGERSDRGRGYGAMALRELCAIGFRDMGLERIHLWTRVDNPAQRLYQRVGFVKEGVQRHALFWDGEWHDTILMSFIRPDWPAP